MGSDRTERTDRGSGSEESGIAKCEMPGVGYVGHLRQPTRIRSAPKSKHNPLHNAYNYATSL